MWWAATKILLSHNINNYPPSRHKYTPSRQKYTPSRHKGGRKPPLRRMDQQNVTICFTLSPSYMDKMIKIEIPSTYVTSKQSYRWWFEINYFKKCILHTETSVPKSVFNVIYLPNKEFSNCTMSEDNNVKL